MVERQLVDRGIVDPFVLRAFAEVPREMFVPPEMRACAYDDGPLPIGAGQTISQPFVVAEMIAAARVSPGDRVLEVGCGSGYAAAVLGRIAARVHTIDRVPVLVEQAAARFAALGYDNVEARVGDGTLGWPEAAPFDAILVAAAGPEPPSALCAQLGIGRALVMPVGGIDCEQQLIRMTRVGPDDWRSDILASVRFVPLIGRQGWREDAGPPVTRPSEGGGRA